MSNKIRIFPAFLFLLLPELRQFYRIFPNLDARLTAYPQRGKIKPFYR